MKKPSILTVVKMSMKVANITSTLRTAMGQLRNNYQIAISGDSDVFILWEPNKQQLTVNYRNSGSVAYYSYDHESLKYDSSKETLREFQVRVVAIAALITQDDYRQRVKELNKLGIKYA